MRIITQTEMGRLAGVASASVQSACRPGGELEAALHGRKIDAEHPASLKFIERRVFKHADPEYRVLPRKPGGTTHKEKIKAYFEERTPHDIHREQLDALAKDIRALAHKSLSELIYHFGDDVRFVDWLKSIREMEVIEDRRLRNAEKRGELVKRDFIHVGIFMTLDACFRGLLTDGAKNIATKGHSMALAGRGVDELEVYVREVMGTFLETARERMKRCLKSV